MNNKKEFGKIGEDLAVDFLKSKGFQIIERNYRYKKAGEIDIIAQRDNLLIFVEVKNRKSSHYGDPRYSINHKKQESIKFIANVYLNLHESLNNKNITCRFDLITIKNNNMEWIEDIIR